MSQRHNLDISRRSIVKAGLGGSLVGLAGCVGSEEPDGLPQPIQFYTWNLGFLEDSINGYMNDFESEYADKYENLEADWVDRGPDTADIISYFESRLAEGNPPHIFDTQYAAYVRYADAGEFAPVEDYVDDEFLSAFNEQIVDLMNYKGTIYQMPFYMGTNMTVSNSKFFDQANIRPPTVENDWTTFEYLDAIKDVPDNSDAKYGLVHIRFDYALWPWFQSAGVDVLNSDNSEAAFNTDTTVDILTRFAELTSDGYIPEVAWTGFYQPAAEFFAARETAMYFGSGSAIRLLQSFGDWIGPDTVTLGPNPRGGGFVTYHGLGVTTTGKTELEMQAAFDFIKVILSKKWQRDFLENTTVLVPNKAAMNELIDDQQFSQDNPLLTALYQQYFEAADQLGAAPQIPETVQIAEIIDEEFSDAALGNKSAQDAVDDAEQRVNNLLS
jgi:ABC-type glycerol-3-phosphate transport system substrate-binding protein